MSNPAETYEHGVVPCLFAPWTRLVELAAQQPGERVLDVACGTGIVVRAGRREQPLERHLFLEALADVMQHHFDVPAAAAPFAFGGDEALRSLLAGAGFAVEIEQVSMTMRAPEPERNIERLIQAMAAAVPAMQEVDAEEQQAMIEAIAEDMAEPQRVVTDGDYIVLPWHANPALGRRAA